MVQAEGSSPRGDVYQICFSNEIMLDLMDFGDVAVFCSRPNSCCLQNLECFDMPLLSFKFVFMKEQQ